MNVGDVARISRLGLVMQLRDATFAPVTLAASKAGTNLLLGASSHGKRLDVVMDYHPEAQAVLSPGRDALANPSQIRVRLDGDDREVMYLRGGGVESAESIAAVAPAAVLAEWTDLVEQLCAIADGRITAVGQSDDRERAMLQIGYPARDRDTEAMLVEGITELGAGIGISSPQLTLFRRIHPELARGAAIVLSTRCLGTAVSAHFGVAYPVTDWQTAVRLATGLVFNDSEAKDVARRLGEVAGAIGAEQCDGVEVVLGPHEPPDVIVWARVAPR